MDVLLIDAFDADGIALSLANSDFYSCAARQLTENGMLVMNFWGPCERYVDNLAQARAAFGDSLLLVPVAGDANVLLFAFKQAPPQAITDELEAVAQRLQMRLLLDFPRISGASVREFHSPIRRHGRVSDRGGVLRAGAEDGEGVARAKGCRSGPASNGYYAQRTSKEKSPCPVR